MKKIGQSYKNLVIKGNIENKDLPNNINNDNPIIKLGIQAPPGSIFTINNNQIMIGLSGIYELEEPGIFITSLITNDVDNYIIDYVQEVKGG